MGAAILRSMCCGLMLATAVQAQEPARPKEPGPEMVTVPAGAFVRGDSSGEPDERPQRRIELPAFRLDRTEVTRGAYASCVQKGACRPPAAPGRAPDPRDLLPPELPVAYVSWHDAAAYCAFAGKRLPSGYGLADSNMRFLALEQDDPSFNWRVFRFPQDLARMKTMSEILSPLDPDLRPFKARNGKLLLYHGWSDPAISAASRKTDSMMGLTPTTQGGSARSPLS